MQFLNNYRGIAILLVLLAHSMSVYQPVNPTSMYIMIDAVVSDCTIIFVVLAGYFFHNLLPSYSYGSFLKGKFLYVILPYLVVSIPAIFIHLIHYKVTHYWIDMEWFHTLNPIEQILFFVFTGSSLGPLWFVPMITICYLISPLLQKAEKYNLMPIIFFLSVIPGVYYGRPEFNENSLHAFAYFFPAYSLGMLLARYDTIYKKIAPYSLALTGFSLAFMFFFSTLVIENSSFDLVVKLVFSVILMGLLYRYLDFKVTILDLLARLSFYLFFIHGYLTGFSRMNARTLGITFDGIWPILFILTYITVICIAGYVVLKLILGKRSKMLIGA